MRFLTRSGCHLCEEAEPVVTKVAARLGVGVEAVDIDSDDDLVRDFGFRIPVVVGPDGTVLAEGVFQARSLRARLRTARRRHRRS